MLQPEDFIKLGAHLSRIDSTLEDFCAEYGFSYDNKGLGRYPRRKIQRCREVNLFYDLQMDKDEGNEFYEEFYEEIPYSLGTGGWIDIGTARYGKIILLFERKPFNLVEQELSSILRVNFREISKWAPDYLINTGVMSKISERNSKGKKESE